MTNHSMTKSTNQQKLQSLLPDLSEQERVLLQDLSEREQANYRGGFRTTDTDGEDYLIWTVVDEGVHS